MKVENIGDVSLIETIYEKRDRIAYITLNREKCGQRVQRADVRRDEGDLDRLQQ